VPAVVNKKTIELGDDDLVEWLLDDDPKAKRPDLGAGGDPPAPLDRAPTRLDAEVKAALTPPPPGPSVGLDVRVDNYDEGWDEVTLPRAQAIVPDVAAIAPLVAGLLDAPKGASLAEEKAVKQAGRNKAARERRSADPAAKEAPRRKASDKKAAGKQTADAAKKRPARKTPVKPPDPVTPRGSSDGKRAKRKRSRAKTGKH
jgi:hypothetical protein